MAVQTKHYTVEEFDHFVDLPENADKLFEYIGGETVEILPHPYASKIASWISSWITGYAIKHKSGHVTGKGGGYMVSGERYAPDVAYISKTRQEILTERGYNPLPPELAVEVLSPSNSSDDMRIKVSNYLAAGTVVWVVNPDKKQVEVHAPGQPAQRINVGGTLDGGTVLPGFSLAVKDIFSE